MATITLDVPGKFNRVSMPARDQLAATFRDLDADVLGIVEAESRPALVRFSHDVLAPTGAANASLTGAPARVASWETARLWSRRIIDVKFFLGRLGADFIAM